MATLRIKTAEGQHVLRDINLQDPFKHLADNITKLTDIPPNMLKLRQGFPPKIIEISSDDCSLTSLGIRSGDTLHVERSTNPTPVPAQVLHQAHTPAPVHVLQQAQIAQGILTRKVVPANNSCLFTSIDFLMESRDSVNLEAARPMRDLIAKLVKSDPQQYTSALLGKSNKEYCKWIRGADSWGGAIELSILSAYYSLEIDVVDTQSGRIDRFGEDQNYDNRILVLYDGIHYDALVLESLDPSRPSYRHMFPTSDLSILIQAQEIAEEAKSSRQYTDVNQFTLRCLVCQKALNGQAEAQNHAQNTGHINFGEF